jgi:hypothetical protein
MMSFQSHSIGVPKVMSAESVGPVPPVRRAMNSRLGPAMRDPESPASGERTGVVVVGVDCCLDRVEGAGDAVTALMRFEPCKTTDGCERGVTAFDNEPHRVAIEVLVVGVLDLGGGKNGSELVEAVFRMVERSFRIVTS